MNIYKATQAIWMIWQYEQCYAQIKERELRDNGSNANTKICFEVRAPCSTSPPSPRRISNPLYSHRGNLYRRGFVTTREYRTPLSNTASQLRGRPVAKTTTNKHLYRRGLTNQLHLTIEGANHNPQPLPKREQPNQSKDFYNKWLQRLQTLLFPQNKKILID